MNELPQTSIIETTVKPNGGGVLVRIEIADGSLGPEGTATIHLDMAVTLPRYRTALLAHYQRGAIDLAHSVLSEHLRNLKNEILPDFSLNPDLDE